MREAVMKEATIRELSYYKRKDSYYKESKDSYHKRRRAIIKEGELL